MTSWEISERNWQLNMTSINGNFRVPCLIAGIYNGHEMGHPPFSGQVRENGVGTW